MVIFGKSATGKILDKVLIDDRKMIDCGPANAAITSFIDLDFECPPRQTIADFLPAITESIERRFRQGWKFCVPKTTEELEGVFTQGTFSRTFKK
jgi:hypothetical protein